MQVLAFVLITNDHNEYIIIERREKKMSNIYYNQNFIFYMLKY